MLGRHRDEAVACVELCLKDNASRAGVKNLGDPAGDLVQAGAGGEIRRRTLDAREGEKVGHNRREAVGFGEDVGKEFPVDGGFIGLLQDFGRSPNRGNRGLNFVGKRERHLFHVGLAFQLSAHFFQCAGEVAHLALAPDFEAHPGFSARHLFSPACQRGKHAGKVFRERERDGGGHNQGDQRRYGQVLERSDDGFLHIDGGFFDAHQTGDFSLLRDRDSRSEDDHLTVGVTRPAGAIFSAAGQADIAQFGLIGARQEASFGVMADPSGGVVKNDAKVRREVVKDPSHDLSHLGKIVERSGGHRFGHDHRRIDHSLLGGSQVASLDAIAHVPCKIKTRKKNRGQNEKENFPIQAMKWRRENTDEALDEKNHASGRANWGLGFHSRNRYPRPRTVSMGSEGRSFLRRVLMWTSTVRSVTHPPSRHARSRICSRVKTRPGCA